MTLQSIIRYVKSLIHPECVFTDEQIDEWVNSAKIQLGDCNRMNHSDAIHSRLMRHSFAAWCRAVRIAHAERARQAAAEARKAGPKAPPATPSGGESRQPNFDVSGCGA